MSIDYSFENISYTGGSVLVDGKDAVIGWHIHPKFKFNSFLSVVAGSIFYLAVGAGNGLLAFNGYFESYLIYSNHSTHIFSTSQCNLLIVLSFFLFESIAMIIGSFIFAPICGLLLTMIISCLTITIGSILSYLYCQYGELCIITLGILPGTGIGLSLILPLTYLLQSSFFIGQQMSYHFSDMSKWKSNASSTATQLQSNKIQDKSGQILAVSGDSGDDDDDDDIIKNTSSGKKMLSQKPPFMTISNQYYGNLGVTSCFLVSLIGTGFWIFYTAMGHYIDPDGYTNPVTAQIIANNKDIMKRIPSVFMLYGFSLVLLISCSCMLIRWSSIQLEKNDNANINSHTNNKLNAIDFERATMTLYSRENSGKDNENTKDSINSLNDKKKAAEILDNEDNLVYDSLRSHDHSKKTGKWSKIGSNFSIYDWQYYKQFESLNQLKRHQSMPDIPNLGYVATVLRRDSDNDLAKKRTTLILEQSIQSSCSSLNNYNGNQNQTFDETNKKKMKSIRQSVKSAKFRSEYSQRVKQQQKKAHLRMASAGFSLPNDDKNSYSSRSRKDIGRGLRLDRPVIVKTKKEKKKASSIRKISRSHSSGRKKESLSRISINSGDDNINMNDIYEINAVNQTQNKSSEKKNEENDNDTTNKRSTLILYKDSEMEQWDNDVSHYQTMISYPSHSISNSHTFQNNMQNIQWNMITKNNNDKNNKINGNNDGGNNKNNNKHKKEKFMDKSKKKQIFKKNWKRKKHKNKKGRDKNDNNILNKNEKYEIYVENESESIWKSISQSIHTWQRMIQDHRFWRLYILIFCSSIMNIFLITQWKRFAMLKLNIIDSTYIVLSDGFAFCFSIIGHVFIGYLFDNRQQYKLIFARKKKNENKGKSMNDNDDDDEIDLDTPRRFMTPLRRARGASSIDHNRNIKNKKNKQHGNRNGNVNISDKLNNISLYKYRKYYYDVRLLGYIYLLCAICFVFARYTYVSSHLMFFIWNCIFLTCLGVDIALLPIIVINEFGLWYAHTNVSLLLSSMLPSIVFTVLCLEQSIDYFGWQIILLINALLSILCFFISFTFSDKNNYCCLSKKTICQSIHFICCYFCLCEILSQSIKYQLGCCDPICRCCTNKKFKHATFDDNFNDHEHRHTINKQHSGITNLSSCCDSCCRLNQRKNIALSTSFDSSMIDPSRKSITAEEHYHRASTADHSYSHP